MPPTASYFDSLDLSVATPPEAVIFGQSEPMKLVRQQVKKFACAKVPVLIEGESGTGKQTLAQFIHCGSPWRDGLFVKINCPPISRTLFEGEPFGYARGGCAISDDTEWGRAAGAHKGTLFLDEIAEVDFPSQGKLLEALRDGQLWRIGAWENQRVEVRLICATSQRLEQEVEAGRFRRDLLYRINVANLRVPALRKRSDDIPGLAEYFLATYNEQYRCKAPLLSTDLLKILKNYDWPGNIRQLENLVKRYVILGSEEVIRTELLGRRPQAMNSGAQLKRPISLKKLTRNAVQALERKVILKALQANRWNRKQAAQALNISYRALLYKIKEAGLPSRRVALARQASSIGTKGSTSWVLGTNEGP